MPDISSEQLGARIGLPEIADMHKNGTWVDFMPAAVTGLSDGDFLTVHQDVYSGRKAELYGETNYNEGLVARNIAQAAFEDGMTPGVMYDFQTFAAEYFTLPNSPMGGTSMGSSVNIHAGGVMTVDDMPFELPREPKLVIDYGAGLTSRSFLYDQVRLIKQGQHPFIYTPLTRLHFTNQALIDTYRLFDTNLPYDMMKRGLYIGREDGTDAATKEMVRSQKAHNVPSEIANVIVCAGQLHTTPAEVEGGIKRAYSLLADEGMLVIKAFARPASDEIGADKIAEWAFETGFEESKATQFESDITTPGALLGSGHFGARELKSIVISK